MHTNRSLFGFAVRAAAFSFVVTGPVLLLQAQQPGSAQTAQGNVLLAEGGAPDLTAPAAAYSSSSALPDALASGRFDLSSAALSETQPPPRRRYGRPNYADSHTNPDGSSKFAFMAGGGASIPLEDTGNYLTTNYAFQVGGGRNFSKAVGVLMQFDYNHFGFQGKTLGNQQALYNSYCTTQAQAAQQCTPITGLDGSSHIWSFTLNPTFTFHNTEKTGAYVVGGVGFYHKVADFTVPTVGEYCDPYYGCYEYQANQVIDDYTSNAFGLNGGVGLTYKPSRFAGERFYMEARFVWVDNQPRAASTTNLYPPNANESYYIPVTFGLRF